jgi:uncharacterized protein
LNKDDFKKIEEYMLECMKDCAHDKDHIYRVLYLALDIAKYEEDVNFDVLITACLLHDIGRQDQFNDSRIRHEVAGSQKAYNFLLHNNWTEESARHVSDSIMSHSYRSGNIPKSIEAKILFDSDKLDVTGTLGIARTLLYLGIASEPLYSLDPEGSVSDGSNDTQPSFFHEFKYKLEKIYDEFHTKRATQIGQERKASAVSFYNSMLTEARSCYTDGMEELFKIVK